MLPLIAAMLLAAAPAETVQPAAGPRARLVAEPDVMGVVLPDGTRVHPGRWWDPYGPNPIKGDHPILGKTGHVVVTGVVDFTYSADQAPEEDFAQRANNTAAFSLELFSGHTVFKPKTISVKATGFARSVVDPGGEAESVEDFSFGETFLEVLLADYGERSYDATSFRGGAQAVNLDTLGLVLNDVALAARVFSEISSNRHQVNVLWARPIRKDVESALNDATALDADLGAVTWTMNDTVPGWDVTYLFAAASDRRVEDRAQNVGWAGVASNGRLGRFVFQPAVYLAAGSEEATGAAGDETTSILAPMIAIDVQRPMNAWNPRLTLLYAPGDADPADSNATAYDAFADKVAFAGAGGTGILANGKAVGGVPLFRKGSVLPSLRGANDRPNFVHAGIQLVNGGVDVAVSPRIAASLDASAFFWDQPDTLAKIASVEKVGSLLGEEVIAALELRPFLNENMVLLTSAAALIPGPGLTDLGAEKETEVRGDARVLLVF